MSTPRVLHLAEKDPDYSTRTALAHVRSALPDATFRTLGRGGDYPTFLSGLLRFREAARGCDIVHAWGPAALRLAVPTVRGPIVFSPAVATPIRSDARWLRAAASICNVRIVCDSETARSMLVRRGITPSRVEVIRPGVRISHVPPPERCALRESLGFRENEWVLVAAGPSTRDANHHAAIVAAAVLSVFDPTFRLLVWRNGPLCKSEHSFADTMLPDGFARFVRSVDDQNVSFEALLTCADAMLVTTPPERIAPQLPIAAAMAAGVPIVGVATRSTCELLADRYNALLVGRATSRMLAQRVLDLREDETLRRSVVDSARARAYEQLGVSRYIDELNAVYHRVLKDG